MEPPAADFDFQPSDGEHGDRVYQPSGKHGDGDIDSEDTGKNCSDGSLARNDKHHGEESAGHTARKRMTIRFPNGFMKKVGGEPFFDAASFELSRMSHATVKTQDVASIPALPIGRTKKGGEHGETKRNR